MYGGVYIIDDGNEILSLCDNRTKFLFHIATSKVSILIIHYEEYSATRIDFEAEIVIPYTHEFVLPQEFITIQGETMTVNLYSTMLYSDHMIYIKFYLIDNRKIQYIQINLEIIAGIEVQDVEFSVYVPDNTDRCVYCTVFYATQFSKFKSRKYDGEIFSKNFKISERIKSAFINISGCGMFKVSIWSFGIGSNHSLIF